MRGRFSSFDHFELVLLPIKIISRALISSQSEKVTHARRIERGVPPSSLRAYRPSSSPRTIVDTTHRRCRPRLRSMHVLPAPIILTQPSIDRIQARRIAEYRRNVAEVVVDCVAYVPTLTSYILAMLMYVRHTYLRSA